MKKWPDRTVLVRPGEPAPWVIARSTSRKEFHLDTVAGRYLVLCFFQSAAQPRSRRILDDFIAARSAFNDHDRSFFGVSTDPDDERQERVRQQLPGMRYFWDFDHAISRRYGLVDEAGFYRPCCVVVDPRLRVIGLFPFDEQPERYVAKLMRFLGALPALGAEALAAVQAPILVVPHVFERDLCQRLIRYHEENGGFDSGFMREKDGKTVTILNHDHKRRRDCEIAEPELRKACLVRIRDRLVPEIENAFQFGASYMERYLVSCYDSESKGHFAPHRDNTTRGTAHRRFAVSLHLNTGEYEGGNLRFPEYGRQVYSAPLGGAVVFSCSLLHEALTVQKGRRYMFLPFLYDEEDAKLQQINEQFIDHSISSDKNGS